MVKLTICYAKKYEVVLWLDDSKCLTSTANMLAALGDRKNVRQAWLWHYESETLMSAFQPNVEGYSIPSGPWAGE